MGTRLLLCSPDWRGDRDLHGLPRGRLPELAEFQGEIGVGGFLDLRQGVAGVELKVSLFICGVKGEVAYRDFSIADSDIDRDSEGDQRGIGECGYVDLEDWSAGGEDLRVEGYRRGWVLIGKGDRLHCICGREKKQDEAEGREQQLALFAADASAKALPLRGRDERW